MLKYLENNLKNKIEQFTKGKMNQFDIDKIKSFKIPILSEKTQIAVFNYLDLINEMTKCNLNKINMVKQMIDCIMKTIPINNMIELSSICNLYEDNKECNLIGIIKNGLTAGTVYKLNDFTKISNNSYYITIKNNQYLLDFIYHWLLYNEIKIKELSNLTQQSNLNKSNLLSLKIPVIDLNKQLDIISYCNEFESQINRYNLDNKAISEKDILSTVFKLNN
jgi:restriction endonuclease S subunit